MTVPLFDAHLDLSWNAMSFDRDQTQPVSVLRERERGMTGKCRGNCTVSLPELRRGGVGVCLATLLCRAMPAQPVKMAANTSPMGERRFRETIVREDIDYANQTIACAAAQGQLAYYRLLAEQGAVRFVRTASELEQAWQPWSHGPSDDAPIGIILSMEGADPMLDADHAAWWWQQGLRTACLAHYGPSAYAMGTGGDGPLTEAGRKIVAMFEKLGLILDLVHTADQAFAEALDLYAGPVFISHGNCRALVPHDRQISDEQIRQVAGRGGVIGVVLDAWMLVPNYHGSNPRPEVTLAAVADHIDHICQVTGKRNHAAIGSDLDGGFGTEQSPSDLDTIADLQKLAPILRDRGYSDDDIHAVFHGNWLRFFKKALPQ